MSLEHLTTSAADLWLLRRSNRRAPVEWLDDRELERARAYRRRSAAEAFVHARTSLRHVLSELLGVAPGKLMLAATPEGKPFLVEPPTALGFNYSRSGGVVAIATASSGDVGVDIEQATCDLPVDELAPLVFSEDELSSFHTVEGARERHALFHAGWVAKEAALKGHGVGLRRDLRTCVVLSRSPGHIRATAHGFRLSSGRTDNGLHWAVAHRPPAQNGRASDT